MHHSDEQMVDFWRDRLDGDEQVALDAAHGCPGNWTTEGTYPVSVADELPGIADVFERVVAFDEGSPSAQQAAHIALHDPARVLRDVEAARKRLAALADALAAGHGSYDLAARLIEYELLPYANHPQYNEDWRP